MSRVGSLLRQRSLYRRYDDQSGHNWLAIDGGGWWVGLPALGDGRFYDAHGREKWRLEYQRACSRLELMSTGQIDAELQAALNAVRFGSLAERMFWLIHAQVITQRVSTVKIATSAVRQVLWGEASPSHWRSECRTILESLWRLHICDEAEPNFDDHTALLTYFRMPERGRHDGCPEGCIFGASDSVEHRAEHGHLLVTVGRGFLGCVEDFAAPAGNLGGRCYQFHHHDDSKQEKRRKDGLQKQVGSGGHLSQVYLPPLLGVSEGGCQLTGEENTMLQLLVRETTRARREKRGQASESDVFSGPMVPPVASNRKGAPAREIECPYLSASKDYSGFNGNQARKGRGYRLRTWASKFGANSIGRFVDCLASLASKLSLIVVAISPSRGIWLDLDQLRQLVLARPYIAERYHVRIYVEAGHIVRWNELFGWPVCDQLDPVVRPVDYVKGLLAVHRLKQSDVARAVGIDPSSLSKILLGKRSFRSSVLDAVQAMIEGNIAVAANGPEGTASPALDEPACEPAPCSSESIPSPLVPGEGTGSTIACPNLSIAFSYVDAGWSILPQLPGQKKPPVKWKEFQRRRPDHAEIGEWWKRWPQAGVLLVLGPLSGVFSIDIDGEAAHEEWCKRVGQIPGTLAVVSGSEDRFRYHLHFQHPKFDTRAKSTPWHPKLEFRGEGGLVVLPPSQHRSGRQYAWAKGRSPVETSLLPLPECVVEALQPIRPIAPLPATSARLDAVDVATSTGRFIRGDYANGPSWNSRLFQAACDMAGRGFQRGDATSLLLTGAAPWNEAERQVVLRTIESAYSHAREPGYE
ncbi:bifunctional DNA primase/polymerase [Rosistilla oblonga]|uniref:bifunctional DNA primase/polymerase n=1 Tax=Rosistilla oblonga TaxID=2527990 RepID=UPI003A96BBCF